ncbi:6-bladed beta-propeller [Belliella marina]|uniref:6-bladed beta-propeller n=1 Tax=Belliella marina TaxID=1644146 RepID=A0ABW4VJ46_9BACT
MKNIPIFLIIGFLLCCNGQDGALASFEANMVIDVDKPITIKYSQLFDTCSIVPLETDGEHYIGSIDKIIYGKENLVVLDNRMAKAVFIFDRKGKIKAVINNQGEGPGEYKFPMNIYMSENEGKIYIHDSGSAKLLTFSTDAQFLDEFQLKPEYRMEDFFMKDDRLYFVKTYVENWTEKIGYTNLEFKNFQPLETYLPGDWMIRDGGKHKYFYKSDNPEEFIYKDFLNKRILFFKSDELSEVVSITFNKHFFEYNKEEKYNGRTIFEKMARENLYVLGDNLIDTKNFMLISVIRGNRGGLAVWDKSTNSTYLVEKTVNDLDEFYPVLFIPEYNNESGQFTFAVDANEFNRIKTEKKREEDNPYNSLLSQISVDNYDNPVLFIYQLKESLDIEKKHH